MLGSFVPAEAQEAEGSARPSLAVSWPPQAGVCLGVLVPQQARRLLVPSLLFLSCCLRSAEGSQHAAAPSLQLLLPLFAGRAWLYLALNENSLESYLRLFQENLGLLHKYYVKCVSGMVSR